MVHQQIVADERLEIRPGAQVISAGEQLQVGGVKRVVLRPETGEVKGIVVGGWIVLGDEVYVPIEAVESADPDAVRLKLTLNELSELPGLGDDQTPSGAPGSGDARGTSVRHTGFYRTAESGQVAAIAGGQPIRAGQVVAATDGDVGTLDLVLIDPATERAIGFVVRKGTFLVRDVIVPNDWVRTIGQDRINLRVTKAQLERLPEYRPDEEITRDVLDKLWYRSDLGPADVQFIGVRTRDGIVELTGHTHTERTRQRIEEIARGVRGVLEVRNYLDTYEALEAAVREALRAAAVERASTKAG